MKVNKMLDMIEAAGYVYSMRAHGNETTSVVELCVWKVDDKISHFELGSTPKQAAKNMLKKLGLSPKKEYAIFVDKKGVVKVTGKKERK